MKSQIHLIEVHTVIEKIIGVYSRLGLWHRRDEATFKETAIKVLYSIYYVMFTISLVAGAIASDKNDEKMFLIEVAIISTVMLTRLLYIMWRQKEIYELLHRIGVHSIKDEEDFYVVNNKLESFMKLNLYFCYFVMAAVSSITLGVPFIASDKKLFFNVGFPLDYKNNDFAYWIAFLFVLCEAYLSIVPFTFSIIVWYLLFNCGLKYQVLGSVLRNLGIVRTVDAVKKVKISELEKRNVFNRDLLDGIKSHKHINETTRQLETVLYELFSVQLATSAACICINCYVLAFNNRASLIEYLLYIVYLLYNICDIFMVMYFGNEIQLLSDALSYCLFESNWMDLPQSCKLTIIIFAERLKQGQQIVTLKLYPLTLETFTRILYGAYRLFNVLKTLAM